MPGCGAQIRRMRSALNSKRRACLRRGCVVVAACLPLPRSARRRPPRSCRPRRGDAFRSGAPAEYRRARLLPGRLLGPRRGAPGQRRSCSCSMARPQPAGWAADRRLHRDLGRHGQEQHRGARELPCPRAGVLPQRLDDRGAGLPVHRRRARRAGPGGLERHPSFAQPVAEPTNKPQTGTYILDIRDLDNPQLVERFTYEALIAPSDRFDPRRAPPARSPGSHGPSSARCVRTCPPRRARTAGEPRWV
jgi:hypothetical protein